MSLGIGGFAYLVLADDNIAIYQYGNFNWNIESCRNMDRVADGLITIPINCFVKAEIHQKRKRMPNRKKKLVDKKILKDVDYRKLVSVGIITIENCSSTWRLTEDEQKVDVMAFSILCHIYREYQGLINCRIRLCG